MSIILKDLEIEILKDQSSTSEILKLASSTHYRRIKKRHMPFFILL